MRILELQAENIKKLRVVSITPTGDVVQITGANGSGKSSVLDCIWWALAGKDAIPSKPVRSGEETATIRLNLGDFIVVRRFNASGTTSVTVQNADGAKYPSPQRLLDELLGTLTFDPLAFSRMAPKQQLETLRGLVRLDVDIDALDAENDRDFRLRTDWNHRTKSFEERVKTLREGIDLSLIVTPVNVSALVAELASASDHNSAIDRDIATRESIQRAKADTDSQITTTRQEIARLEQRLTALEKERVRIGDAIDALPPLAKKIDVTALTLRIDEAQKENARREFQARQRAALTTAEAELAESRAEAEALTAAMEARSRQKAQAIGSATMPVDGLSFGSGEVLYDGIPLAQASSAEQLRVSVALAMAANPKLRVLRIQDGSLLDERSLSLIADMARAHDYQCWIERVDTSGHVGVVMEEGEVVAIDGVPVPAKSDETSAAVVGA